jgi:hypothetical protein
MSHFNFTRKLPSLERVREFVDYDPETGEFRWRQARRKSLIGTVIPKGNSGNYQRIKIGSVAYPAQRLAWLLGHGEDPGDLQVDHINRVRDDNRLVNLRLADRSQQGCNKRRSSRNTSGYKGVSWNSQCGRWVAAIEARGHSKHLGLFDCPKEAHAAYCKAAEELHGEFACPG